MSRFAIVVAALLTVELAPSSSASERPSTLSVIFENDLFYHADRDYTNGVEVSWSPSDKGAEVLPSSIQTALSDILDLRSVRSSYSLGQMMFTPEHTATAIPLVGERPYAGFLYGALALTEQEGTDQSQLRVQLGMIGPASLAADSQKLIHRLRGIALPQGWRTQLRDEPGLVISYEKRRTFVSLHDSDGAGMDFRARFGGTVGNVFDYLNTGITGRVGFHLPKDDGPSLIEPSIMGSYAYDPVSSFGAYLFAGAEARLVGRNIFLDGNSFHSSRWVAKKTLVGDFIAGGAVTFEQFQLSFVHTFRSREYSGQKDFDEFGTLSLSVNL